MSFTQTQVSAEAYVKDFGEYVGIGIGSLLDPKVEYDEITECECENECECDEFETWDEEAFMLLYGEKEDGEIVEVEFLNFNDLAVDFDRVTSFFQTKKYTFIEFGITIRQATNWDYTSPVFRTSLCTYDPSAPSTPGYPWGGEVDSCSYIMDNETGYMFEIKLDAMFTLVGDNFWGQKYLYPVIENEDRVYITTFKRKIDEFYGDMQSLYELRIDGNKLVQKKIIDLFEYGLDLWGDGRRKVGNVFHFVDRYGNIYYSQIREYRRPIEAFDPWDVIYSLQTRVITRSGYSVMLNEDKNVTWEEIEGMYDSFVNATRESPYLTLAFNGRAYTKNGKNYIDKNGNHVRSGFNPIQEQKTRFIEMNGILTPADIVPEYIQSVDGVDYFFMREFWSGDHIISVTWHNDISYSIEVVKEFGHAYQNLSYENWLERDTIFASETGLYYAVQDGYSGRLYRFDIETMQEELLLETVHNELNWGIWAARYRVKYSEMGRVLIGLTWREVQYNGYIECYEIDSDGSLMSITEEEYERGITKNAFLQINRFA